MLKRKREEKDKHGSNNPNKKPIKPVIKFQYLTTKSLRPGKTFGNPTSDTTKDWETINSQWESWFGRKKNNAWKNTCRSNLWESKFNTWISEFSDVTDENQAQDIKSVGALLERIPLVTEKNQTKRLCWAKDGAVNGIALFGVMNQSLNFLEVMVG
ncbi:7303_t:CDS:2, partial [Paraglomus brasilianum]